LSREALNQGRICCKKNNKEKEKAHKSTIRDAHGKDFWPIFDHFSLQLLFNFTANFTFFAVKLKEN